MDSGLHELPMFLQWSDPAVIVPLVLSISAIIIFAVVELYVAAEPEMAPFLVEAEDTNFRGDIQLFYRLLLSYVILDGNVDKAKSAWRSTVKSKLRCSRRNTPRLV